MVGQLHVPVVDSSPLSVGSTEITTSLAHIVCDGLMALPFFVIGLEVRREFSRGELTDRRRAVIPMVAGLVGMLIPALIFLAVNG